MRTSCLKGPYGCDDIPPIVETDYIGRIQIIKLVNFLSILDIDVPSQASAKDSSAQLEHFVKNFAEQVSVQAINYDDHFFPLRVVYSVHSSLP